MTAKFQSINLYANAIVSQNPDTPINLYTMDETTSQSVKQYINGDNSIHNTNGIRRLGIHIPVILGANNISQKMIINKKNLPTESPGIPTPYILRTGKRIIPRVNNFISLIKRIYSRALTAQSERIRSQEVEGNASR